MSTQVATTKFSFPFSCTADLSRQEEEHNQTGHIQIKALSVLDPQQNQPVVEQKHHEIIQVGPGLPTAGDLEAVLVCLEPPGLGGNQKLSADGEDQRPATKRQLSSESAARTVAVVKKSAVRNEAEDQPRLDTRCVATANGKRKRRRDLFTDAEVFRRVDSHVLQAGAQLKEKQVHDVQVIVRNIVDGARNELERLRAVWVWLCHNIEYDVSGYLGHSEKLSSPEEVIASGRGVCCGYSSLCMQMCREVGIECQEVPGHSKGIGYRQGRSLSGVKSDHLWNAVLLGRQWFLLDACWGAGRVDMERQCFVRRFDDFYFLTDPEEFIHSHFPDEKKWQLLDVPISLEEFEKGVFKTSAFFSLGLQLIQPRHAHIVTVDGEANVSLGFSRPVTFTYEITQHRDLLHTGASEQKESGGESSCHGLLTVCRRSMKLRLLPPASGVYNLKVFARPESATTPLLWVCSFMVECPEPRAREEIPDNPFLSWGLQPSASTAGVAGSSQDGQVAEVKEGIFQLVLKTSRPLMALCELVHPQLEATVAKRCLATQIEPAALTCHVLCPLPGFYRLSVFVRDHHMSDVQFRNAANFLLHSKATQPLSPDTELFPPNLSSVCGPGTRTLEAGLTKFSHTAALLSTQQGKCNITFHNQQDLELHAVLSWDRSQASALARQLFCTQMDSKVTVSVSLPGAGVYRLGLYARRTPGGDFDPMCDFVVRNGCARPGPPFPAVYSAWGRGCVLFEPREGLLEPRSWVRFRMRVPGAQRVSVIGASRTDLKMNKSRVWEGEVFSGDGPGRIKVAAALGESADMSVLLIFDIEQRPEGGD